MKGVILAGGSGSRRHPTTVAGNKVTPADRIAKLRLVIEVAEEVWG